MKKMLLIIILLMAIWRIDCEAKVYYTDYSLINEVEAEDYEGTDLLKKEEVIKYNNYCYGRTNAGYYKEGYNPDASPYIDNEDSLIEEERSLNYSLNASAQHLVYAVNPTYKIKYIKISDFVSSNSILKSIKVYNKGEELDINLDESNYYDGEKLGLESFVIINLNNAYSITDLKLELNIESDNTNVILFTVNYYSDFDIDYREFSLSNFINKTLGNTKLYIDLMSFANFNAFKEEVAPGKSDIYDWMKYYVTSQKKYLYYDLEKTYLNEYTINPLEGYSHDENDYINSYNYYKRDKFILNDEINSLDEFLIIYSSIQIGNFRIEGNIDFEKNGEYQIILYIDEENYFAHTLKINIPEEKPPIEEEDVENQENPPIDDFDNEKENSNDKNDNENSIPDLEEGDNPLDGEKKLLDNNQDSNNKKEINNNQDFSNNEETDYDGLLILKNQNTSDDNLLALNNDSSLIDNSCSSDDANSNDKLIFIFLIIIIIILLLLLFMKKKKKN